MLPSSPGIPNGLRRTISATQFSFGLIDGVGKEKLAGNVDDMRIDSRLLDNISTVDGPTIVGSIGTSTAKQAETAAGGIQGHTATLDSLTTAIGGTESSSMLSSSTTRMLSEDPLTGRPMDVMVKVRRISQAHGEEVLTTITKTLKSDKDIK